MLNRNELDHVIATLTKELQDFFEVMVRDCTRLKVRIEAYNYGDLTADGAFVNGYFDSEERVLAFSIDPNNLRWLGTLIHEYSHMLQWANRRTFWDRVGKYHGDLWDWIDGRNMSNRKRQRSLKANIIIEFDNEIQTVRLIKKFNLEGVIDIAQYTQQAISYVLFYYVVYRTKRFYRKGQEPYNLPEVYTKMPTTFNFSPLNPPAHLLEVLYRQYCNDGKAI